MSSDDLVRRVVEGDREAWWSLQRWAADYIERWARSHPRLRRARLQGNVDEVREVLADTLERVHKDGFQNLRMYLDQQPEAGASVRSLEQWLFGVTDFAVREHVRQRHGRGPRKPQSGEAQPSTRISQRHVQTLAERLEHEDRALAHLSELTSKLTLREIMRHVRECFSAREAEAIRLCFEEGRSYDDVASMLGLHSHVEAETMIRKLKERLRVRFRDQL